VSAPTQREGEKPTATSSDTVGPWSVEVAGTAAARLVSADGMLSVVRIECGIWEGALACAGEVRSKTRGQTRGGL
jgi:hypothetical protein